MKKFQEMCQEEFEKIELMARGGQKIVFDGVHNSYGETVIKLYFQLIHAPHTNILSRLTIPGLLGKYK